MILSTNLDWTSSSSLVSEGFSMGMSQVKSEAIEFIEYLHKIENRHDFEGHFMEIGTKWGGNFWMLCRSANNDSLKISVDLPKGDFGGWVLGDHPYMGDTLTKRDKFFKNQFANVHMIHGDSTHYSTRIKIEQLLGYDKKLSLLFLDGNHSYEGVKKNYDMYKDFVHKDGAIIFHDINDTEHHRDIGVEVGKFWNEVEGKKIEFNAGKHWAGIGVLRNWL